MASNTAHTSGKATGANIAPAIAVNGVSMVFMDTFPACVYGVDVYRMCIERGAMVSRALMHSPHGVGVTANC